MRERARVFTKMAKMVLFFSCFLTTFYIARALNCYSCQACGEEQDKWNQISCGKTNLEKLENICGKYVIKDKSGVTTVERKCVLADRTADGYSYKCVTLDTESSRECHTCQTDLCNSASSSNISFFTALTFILVCFTPKFLIVTYF